MIRMLTRGIKSKEDDIIKLAGKLDAEIHNSFWRDLFPEIFPSSPKERRIDLESLSWKDLKKLMKTLRRKIGNLILLTREITELLNDLGGFPNNANGLRTQLRGNWSFARQLIRKGERFLEREIEKRKKEIEELEK